MKRHLFSGLFLLFSFGMGAYASQEKYVSFNDNWLFTLSDSHDYSLTTYNPEGWRQLDLPHDWTIEKPFDKNLEGCTAFTPGGIGWYSKIFKTEISENQKCYIIFDGVYNNADFWINGMRLGNHPYGYAPIWYDLTDFIEPENGINRLSVRVDHSRYADSRWYTGSGIYRNVKMLITDKLHIPVWGTFITTPVINKESASVNIRVDVENDYSEAKSGRVYTDIYDADNKKVATVSTAFNLASGEKVTLNQDVELFDPKLWDIDSPYLYIAKTYIVSGNETIGNRETRFGVRTIHFDKDKGFFLNGKNMKVKGVCLHHDAGIVGTAVPKDVWKRRLAILKAGGCNAIRTAHNPASDEFLDLCDEMGFLVQNEFYDEWDLPKDKRYNMHDKEVDYITRGHSEHFQQWAEIDLKNVMRSSRNHPCIFQWSIGNEIEWTYPGNRSATGLFGNTDRNDKMDWTLWRTPVPPNSPEVVREFWRNYPRQTFSIGKTAAKLAKWSREMDTTRYVIANLILPTSSFETGYTDVLDIAGFSYKPAQYDYLREKYPNKIKLVDKENGGLSDARNYGIPHATGEYIAFLDSDDYVELDTYEKMYNKAKEDDSDLVECDFIWEYPDRKKIDTGKIYNNKKEMLTYARVVAWNKLIKRSLIEEHKIEFPKGLRYEDVEFFYKMVPYYNKVSFVKEPLIHYIQRSSSISNTQNERTKEIFTIMDNVIKYYKENNLYEEYKTELEYTYARLLLCSSLFRITKIEDAKIRKQLLNETWTRLNNEFPNWKKNEILKKDKSAKNFYMKTVNKFTYKIYCAIFSA